MIAMEPFPVCAKPVTHSGSLGSTPALVPKELGAVSP